MHFITESKKFFEQKEMHSLDYADVKVFIAKPRQIAKQLVNCGGGKQQKAIAKYKCSLGLETQRFVHSVTGKSC
jgi:hypothetical protein